MIQIASQISNSAERIKRSAGARITLAIALVIAVLVCCSISRFVSRAHSEVSDAAPSESISGSASETAAPAVQAPTGLLGTLQVVQFALYDVGIYPREVHADQGIVGVCFEDLSGGMNHLVIQLATSGAPVGVVLRTGPAARGRNDFKLLAGRYNVFMADHPEIVSTLIVDPN